MQSTLTPMPSVAVENAPAFRGHILALDGLRGLAISMVMLMHFTALQKPRTELGRVLHEVLGAGWIGVYLFFVLSGFLITGILLDTKESPHYFVNFFARRSLRIFPLYYGYLAILLCVGVPMAIRTGLMDSPNVRYVGAHQGYFWLYGTNVLLAERGAFLSGFVDHLWSLAIEEHFYLIWPAVLFFVPNRKLLAVCCGIVGMAIGCRAGFTATGVWPLANYLFTPCRMDSLAIGGIVAVAVRLGYPEQKMLDHARWLFVVCGLLVISYFVLRNQIFFVKQAYDVVGKSFTAIFFAAMLVLAIDSSPSIVGRSFSHPILRFLGKYSYGLYVFHLPVWLLKMRLLPPERLASHLGSGTLVWMLDVVIPFALSVGIAFLSWHFYEKKFLKFKEYFEPQKKLFAGGATS